MGVNLADLIKERLGVKTFARINPVVAAVGLTGIEILKQSPSRVAFTIVNLSVNELYIGPFNTVSTTKGIRVAPSGGSVSYLWDEDFDIVGWQWYAIATGAASDILVIEQLTDRE